MKSRAFFTKHLDVNSVEDFKALTNSGSDKIEP